MFNLPYKESGRKILWQVMRVEARARGGCDERLGLDRSHRLHNAAQAVLPMDVDMITSFSMAVETAMKVGVPGHRSPADLIRVHALQPRFCRRYLPPHEPVQKPDSGCMQDIR